MNLRTLFGGKANVEMKNFIENGVEKFVQYGQKTLKVMKPETEIWAHSADGILYKCDNGICKLSDQIIGHSKVTSKDVFVLDGNEVVERLHIRQFGYIDGIVPESDKAGKCIYHAVNPGKPNAYQNMLRFNPVGKSTFNYHF